MYEIANDRYPVVFDLLEEAIKSGGVPAAKYVGMSTGPYGVRVHLSEAPTPAEQTAVENAITAHDPALLSADKDTIANDGADVVTITVWCPHTSGSSVVFVVEGVAVDPVDLDINKRASIELDASGVLDRSLSVTVQGFDSETLEIEVIE